MTVHRDASSEPPNRAIQLALALYREPLLVRDRVQAIVDLPDGITELLRVAGADLDALASSLADYGVAPDGLREAARFFIQQVMLLPGVSYYRTLGVEPDAQLDRIRAHHRLLMRLFHPDRHAGAECWTDAYAGRVNRAYNTLRNAQSRRDYDQGLTVEAVSNPVIFSAPNVVPAVDSGSWRPATGGSSEAGNARATSRPAQRAPQLVLAAALLLAILFVLSVYRNNRQMTPNEAPVVAGSVQSERRPEPVGSVAAEPPLGPAAGRPSIGPLPAVMPSGAAIGLSSGPASATASALAVDPSGRGSEVAGADEPVTVPGRVEPPAVAATSSEPAVPPSRPRMPLPVAVAAVAPPAVGPHPAANRPEPTSGAAEIASDSAGTARRSPPEVALPPAEIAAVRSPPPRVVTVVSGQRTTGAFTQEALMSLKTSLVETYQRGDLVAFMALFGTDARTSDEVGTDEIQTEYGQLFRETDRRRMRISKLAWERHGRRMAGIGRVDLMVLRDGEEQWFRGGIIIEVARERQRPVIVGLFYRLERS